MAPTTLSRNPERMASEQTAVVSGLYRYPVKGLSPQPLAHVALQASQPFPADRVYALARPGAPVDAADPKWAKKGMFIMLMLDEALATVTTDLDVATRRMTVTKDGQPIAKSDFDNTGDRDAFEKVIWGLLPALPAPPTLLASRGGHFMDKPDNVISLINLATVRSLEQQWGCKIDPLRFRANIYIDGVAPWQEFDWIGSNISLGAMSFRVDRRNGRCGATNVDPKTGARDMNIPQALRRDFGHKDLGVYLVANTSGSLTVGDAVTTHGAQTAESISGAATAVMPHSFMCRGCFYIYDESKGVPQHSISPGTAFSAIPGDWRCPDCGTDKTSFRPYTGE